MLIKEIRKPEKYNFFQRKMHQYQNGGHHTTSPKLEEIGVRAAIPPEHRLESDAYLDKPKYIAFVEEAKKKWKVGDIVTLRAWPIIPGRLDAPPYYIVSDFQELRQYAVYDPTYKELRIVGLRPGQNIRDGLFQFHCPSSIRELTDQEKFLVNVHHQKADGNAKKGETDSNEGYSG